MRQSSLKHPSEEGNEFPVRIYEQPQPNSEVTSNLFMAELISSPPRRPIMLCQIREERIESNERF